MTKQEFIDRAIVNVSDEEFEAIHIVYVASDLDKDTFCKMWKKMNHSRVKGTKANQKRVKELSRQIEKLHKILDFIETLSAGEYYNKFISKFASERMMTTLEENHIEAWFHTPYQVKNYIDRKISEYLEEIANLSK